MTRALRASASVLLFFGGWELASRLGWISPVLASSPSRALLAAAGLLADGAVRGDLAFTLGTFAAGLTSGALTGVVLGVLMGASDLAEDALLPLLIGSSALPKIVLMPIVVLWLGIGASSNVFMAALMSAFPVLVAVRASVAALDPARVAMARSFGASRWRVVRSVIAPSLLPSVVAGLRVAASYALVGALIAEFFGASQGIGYRMVVLMAGFAIDDFFGCVLLVIAFALLVHGGLHLLERRARGERGLWGPA